VASILTRISKIFSRDKTVSQDSTDEHGILPVFPASGGTLDDSTAYAWYYKQMQIVQARRKVYQEYDGMDESSPEVSAALDAYADNATSGDPGIEDIVKIRCDKPKVTELLMRTKNQLKLDAQLWSITRELAKYGECFEELVLNMELTPVRLKNLPGSDMIRNEDPYGRLPDEGAFSQLEPQTDQKVVDFAKWQIIHFRLIKSRQNIYGDSTLKSALKIYKQLCMMEDAIVIARLTRANLRIAYAVDVEGLTPSEAYEHIQQVRKTMRKRRTINPRTGKMDLEFNPLSIEEDIFYGVRADSKADVKVLQGDTNVSNLRDLEYFQNKLMSALKVPKSYLGFEREVGSRATLTEQDIRFARTIRRIQYAVQLGLRQLFDFVLELNNYDPAKIDYTIMLPTASTVDELRIWQATQIKMEVASRYRELFGASDEWILRYLLQVPDEDIKKLLKTQEPKTKPKDGDDFYITAPGAATDEPTDAERIAAIGNAETEQVISDRDLVKLREQLKKDIEALQDLINWELGKEELVGNID